MSGGPRLELTQSADGTSIARFVDGSGPPLVLVHGVGGDHARWDGIRERLAARWTVHAVDRRGRGASGDGASYALEREAQDLTAVIDAVSGNPDVVAHSYGAVCALEAALLSPGIRRLVLYEPPLGIRLRPGEETSLAVIEDLIRRGCDEEALLHFMTDRIGMTPAEIAAIRSAPSWEARKATVHTLPRELRSMRNYDLRPDRFSSVEAPVLLLVGGRSNTWIRSGSEALAAALPDVRVVELPGQAHVAMDTDIDAFVKPVVAFLSSPPVDPHRHDPA